LVVALGVIMFEELPDGVAQRRFAKEDHPRQAFVFDRPNNVGSGDRELLQKLCGAFVARRHEKLAKWGSQPYLDETQEPRNIQVVAATGAP